MTLGEDIYLVPIWIF